MADKLTDAEKAAARRMLTAIKTWWLAPLGNDSVEIDEVVDAFEEAREID
jgi:hypothetical protein